jgi:predicted AAA+ superfamily ATPase
MVKGDEGVRFENLVACCLLKHLNAIEDYEGRRAELKYLRTKEKREVDFALVVEDRPISLVETKRKYGFSAVQVIKNLRQERISDSVELRKGVNFLKTLKL